MIRVGWETDQVTAQQTSVAYWLVRFRPYVEPAVNFEFTLTIYNLYYFDFTFNIDKFMANWFVEFYLFANSRLCFLTGYQLQSILITLQTNMKFQQCYKTMIQSLCDWSQWTSASAKIFDSCSMSADEQVTVLSYNPVQSDKLESVFPAQSPYAAPPSVQPPSGTADTCIGQPNDFLTGIFPLFVNLFFSYLQNFYDLD